MAKEELPEFDKYKYYVESVQNPEEDAKFLAKVYREIKGKTPKKLREDFCGTYATCCEWVKINDHYQAVGVDLDSEPLEYGKKNYFSQLNDHEKNRVETKQQDVTKMSGGEYDVINAMNFSYFIFKEREKLKEYFQSVYDSLDKDGMFIMDIFGGSDVEVESVEETEYEDENFSYYWDHHSFNPIERHSIFHIHFKRKGEPKREEVFTYDWRVWTIPEIRDVLKEVGFKNTHVYWEGTTDDGEGNGEFKRVTSGESGCESWIAYIVAEANVSEAN